MKITWDRKDVFCGLCAKRDRDGPKRNGVIVGYIVGEGKTAPSGERSNLCIISLDDGLVIARGMSYRGVAEWLTTNEALPMSLIGRRQTEFKDDDE